MRRHASALLMCATLLVSSPQATLARPEAATILSNVRFAPKQVEADSKRLTIKTGQSLFQENSEGWQQTRSALSIFEKAGWFRVTVDRS
jgi:hypothetical protein